MTFQRSHRWLLVSDPNIRKAQAQTSCCLVQLTEQLNREAATLKISCPHREIFSYRLYGIYLTFTWPHYTVKYDTCSKKGRCSKIILKERKKKSWQEGTFESCTKTTANSVLRGAGTRCKGHCSAGWATAENAGLAAARSPPNPVLALAPHPHNPMCHDNLVGKCYCVWINANVSYVNRSTFAVI